MRLAKPVLFAAMALTRDAWAEAPSPTDIVVQGQRRKRDAEEIVVDASQGAQAVGTEGDPVKVVEDLPGVGRPSFGSGNLIVWGSSPGDTRTYVDGVEVPRPFHGSGLRSTINGGLVRDVALVPGGYGVEEGRAIGGVVRIGTRDLPERGVHGYLGADVLDASAMVTVAPTEAFRIGIAGRYGYIDRLVGALSDRDVGAYVDVPAYQDYQAKAQWVLREGESVDVVALVSRDALARSVPAPDPEHVRRQDDTEGFERLYGRYRRDTSDGARIEVAPWVGRDESRTDDRFGARPAYLEERSWLAGLRAAHRSRLSSSVTMTVGFDAAGKSADLERQGSLTVPAREGDIAVFGQPPGDDANTDAWHANIVDVAPYVSFDWRAGPLTVTPGLRVDGYLLEASRQTPRVGQTPSIGSSRLEGSIQPRVAVALQVAPALTILATAGLYSQPPDAVDLSAVFGSPSLGLASAYHLTLGERLAVSPALSLEATAFYRGLADLAVRDPSPTPQLAHALLDDGVGRAFGMQLLVRQQPWHGFFGWLAYTISRSERRDAPGASFRLFDDDQSHVLTAIGSKAIGAWTLGMRLRIARGLPRTPVVGSFYDAKDDEFQPIFGAQNSARLPDFWQLDARIDRRFNLADDLRLVVYLELLNLTNHANAEELAYSLDYKRRDVITGLGAMAVLGARVAF